MQANRHHEIADKIASLHGAIAAYPDSKTWFIALSGGADSIALLHLLAPAAKACGASLCALIVNHNLRPEADDEAQMVAARCRAQGFDAHILTVTQSPPQAAIQEWARARRYDLLCGHARRHGGILWFAHHSDDQCETIAMRLARASGLAGLGGIKEMVTVQGVPVLRPLLDVPKQELVSFCAAQDLAFVSDPSNENARFERVRWRKLLSQDEVLARQVTQLGHLSRAIEGHLWHTLDGFMAAHVTYDGLTARCDLAAFDTLPEGARIAVLRRLFALIGKGGYPASRGATKQIAQRIIKRENATLAACLVRCEGAHLVILPEAGRGHEPFLLGANQEHLYQGRFLIRSPFAVMIAPMTQAHIVASDEHSPYGAALRQMPPPIRMIFPYLHALDGTPITPHIKDRVYVGHFGQMVWPNEQVEIYPLGTIAKW